MTSYSLLELNNCIRQQLKNSMPEQYWVVAEINELHVNGAGHCFLELIEKAPKTGQITAKARANIWAYHFRMLSPYFKSMTGKQISTGMKVMLQAGVEFHEVYGFSLNVTNINPAFTLGEMAMQRQAIIQKLIDEGVFDMNRELDLPYMPQRIAVISSETAAGYGDFVNQLHNNAYGYAFKHKLFHSTMQGNDAETSIVQALEQIFEMDDEFDVVVLIRGGGSQSDLNCFNSYRIAAYIAQFPLPVITGIGHERDETIADLVACVHLKTPTAVAEFLIQKAISIHSEMNDLEEKLKHAIELLLHRHAGKLQNLSQRLQSITHLHARKQDREMHALQIRLKNAVSNFMKNKNREHLQITEHLHNIVNKKFQEHKSAIPVLQAQLKRLAGATLSNNKNQIARLEEKIHLLDPVKLLKRGYSITMSDGKVVRNAKTLKKGQLMETILHDGNIESIVK